jgi:hypothetical protein
MTGVKLLTLPSLFRRGRGEGEGEARFCLFHKRFLTLSAHWAP